jgi:uncharacterized protein YjbI with pentapeptide repeats
VDSSALFIVSVMEEEKGKQPWTLREFGGKTLWDWLQLLIVPVVLSLITVAFALWQDIRQDQIENKRAKAERELAVQRAQDEALQAYFDQMSTLILEKDLRHADVRDEAPTVARARTLAVLVRLDPSRKAAVIQFLADAGLVQGRGAYLAQATGEGEVGQRGEGMEEAFKGIPVISLSGADLSGADLSELGGGFPVLSGDSSGMYYSGGSGTGPYLSGADLSYADLSGANLHFAFLNGANLENADLSGANLSDTSLNGANLLRADLSGADLRQDEAMPGRMSEEEGKQLKKQAASLKGATMPNGQKYEDWLKSKDSGEDGDNQ